MDVEVVAYNPPARLGRRACEHRLQKGREVRLRAPVADPALDLTAGHIETGDQRLRAVAAVLELATLDLALAHRPARGDALQRLDAAHLVDGHRAHPLAGRR